MRRAEILYLAGFVTFLNISITTFILCHWNDRLNENNRYLSILSEKVELQTALVGHYARTQGRD